MTVKKKFLPVRGLESKILEMSYNDECLYFATDTKKIYMDANGTNKIPMGGAGNSGIYYGTREPLETDTEEDSQIIFKIEETLEGNIRPELDDLILNEPDGAFYRVISIIDDNKVKGKKLTVSGNGGGGGTSTDGLKKRTSVTVQNKAGTSSLVNGQSAIAEIQVKSGIDTEDNVVDPTEGIFIVITLQVKNSDGTWTTYYTETIRDLDDQEIVNFDFGRRAKASAVSKLTVVAEGANGKASNEQAMPQFSMDELSLTMSENFKTNVYFKSNAINISCNALGAMNRMLDFYFDGELIESKELNSTDTGRNVICEVHKKVADISHGNHTVKIELHQLISNERKMGTDPISFEIGVDANQLDPIIWLGNYKSEYFNYDDIEIPYYIYVPVLNSYTVTLLKDNLYNNEHPFTNVSGTITDSFEIVDADEDGVQNFYTISCASTASQTTVSRDITFKLVDDPERDMHLQEELSLDLFFNAKGRSNNESETNRKIWKYNNSQITDSQTYTGNFDDFNWYNNGWIKTDDGTALRISNGASFSIPIGSMTFSGSDRQSQSHTFEFQFKVRNVQTYSNLISNITRYKQDDEYYKAFYGYVTFQQEADGASYNSNVKYFYKENEEYKDAEINTSATYNQVKNAKGPLYIGLTEGYKTEYTNYEVFLKQYAANHDLDYDAITDQSNYDYTQKIFNLDALACGYYSGSAKSPIGLGLGPQDAFFSNGTNTVNVSYVEDKMVNLTMTYSHVDKLMSIYINGVLTGVIYSTLNGAFTVDTDKIVFNSKYCDIDLYKMRIYRTDLSINQVVTNYAVDLKDVIVYDQNTLVDANDKNLFSFNEMIAYNEAHPEDPIMPYIIFDTSNSDNGDRLSWSKKIKPSIGVEFVNTVLDRAFQSGEIEELAAADGVTAEQYYLHHCPSWKGTGISMAVQGTSSEFYPRRNYKLKCSGCMTAHKGPYLTSNKTLDWFYMDNYDVGTTKFTMKIDYMESSGSYNRGLGNLVANAHAHHPLHYYAQAGALEKENAPYSEATTYDPTNTTYYYYNHKGNMKCTDGTEDNLTPITSAAQFAKGPVALYAELRAAHPEFDKTKVITNTESPYYNKWYVGTGETTYTVDTSTGKYKSLRTNVQGFPVLAFHKKSDGSYTYIGRYNMLSDKGSDEMYGFAISGICQKFLNHQPVSKVAECWEFSNNSREFCSFRDPLKRKHLSFNTNRYLDTSTSTAPVMVEDFEYRYSSLDDMIDIIVGAEGTRIDSLTVDQINSIKSASGVEVISNEIGQDLIYDIYSNWERAVAWVWSTCLEDVKHESEILALPESERQQYLIEKYVALSANATYDSSKTYYQYKRHLYTPYTYNATTWETDRASLYTLENPTVTYLTTSYIYDSYEYRYDKFKYELQKHFNLDYLATYFVVTECLELYDSRGKNCMMASWGPMEENGDWIWFPIFYDMDTQLGINNSGIPSFEFSVDATEEGIFSTNDSILWNNFYTIFKGQMIQKYQQLRGTTQGLGDFEALPYAPFMSEERIEGWYESDPTICKSITMRGQRPLSAINLDEWYKYIAIENQSGGGYLGQTGNIVYDNTSTSDGTGSPKGSYFYALQGDRSLSRIQFLKNRFNYLDSWLGLGIYNKSGGAENAFWGRLTANNINGQDITSDKWVATADEPYFITDAFGNPTTEKRHEFDSEYWLTLTPARKSYLKIICDDSEGTGKYTDTPVKIEVEKIKSGIQTSINYSEQLVYIYGTEIMKDFGDLYKLYLTELHTVDSKKLTHLTLGWDGLDKDGNPWYNKNTNTYALSSMPLLQEFNFSNIQYKNSNEAVIDLTASEKLQNFRAKGSNLQQVKFAEGVALNTLYLPTTITSLELTEARQLTNLVTTYETPTLDTTTNRLKANKGLYIEGFTDRLGQDNAVTNIHTLSILNANNLEYDAYRLLKGYFDIKESSVDTSKIAMTEVDWSPYKLVDEGTVYNSSKEYYLDNGSYQLVPYTYNPDTDKDIDDYNNVSNIGREWNANIKNKVLYVKDTASMSKASLIQDVRMLEVFANKDTFKGTAENSTIPNISGVIYIDNSADLYTTNNTKIDEYYVRNTLQVQYPNLKFFFKTIEQNYTAQFILIDDDNNRLYTTIGKQTIKEGWFTNPITLYDDISDYKTNFDFYGWSTTPEGTVILVNLDNPTGTWASQSLDTNVHQYTFYAIFKVHSYKITFKNADANQSIIKEFNIPYGEYLTVPTTIPSISSNDLDIDKCYAFKGYAKTSDATSTINISTIKSVKDMTFYAIYELKSVYDNPLSSEYFTITSNSYLVLKSGITLSGKITIPSVYNNQPILGVKGFKGQSRITHLFFAANSQVNKIDDYAFQNCPKLKYVKLPSSITTLGNQAFNTCAELFTDMNQSDIDAFFANIQSIGQGCFIGLSTISGKGLNGKNLVLSSNLNFLGSSSFKNIGTLSKLQFGTQNAGCSIDKINIGLKPFEGTAISSIWFYSTDANREQLGDIQPQLLNAANGTKTWHADETQTTN